MTLTAQTVRWLAAALAALSFTLLAAAAFDGCGPQ